MTAAVTREKARWKASLASRPARPRGLAAGFTLIELMLAIAILALITTLMWSSFSQASRNKKRIEAQQERTHTVRTALLRMAREIEMSFLSESEEPDATLPRTQFLGVSRPDVDELWLTSFAHQRLRNGAPESDAAAIGYFGERDPEDRRILNLMRKESRRLMPKDPHDIPGETYIFCPDIVRLKFSYYDYRKKEWHDDWDSKVLGMNYLPSHVHIALTVLDDEGRELTYATDARVQLTDRVGYRN
jgi:general secretion pathway protein J